MKVLQFPLAKVTILFTVGILLAHFGKPFPLTVLAFLGLSFLALIVVFYLSKQNALFQPYFGISVVCFSICMGASTLTLRNGYFQETHYIHQVGSNENDHELEVLIREKLKATVNNQRYIAIVNRIDQKKSCGKILLNFRKESSKKTFAAGTGLLIRGKIFKPKQPDNPDQFDYGRYLTNQSILAQMYINIGAVNVNQLLKKDAFYYAGWLRDRILRNMKNAQFPTTELAVIAALILGQQQDIAPEILHDYQFAGAIHILSVSGLHVGFILLFLNFALGYLPKNKTMSYAKLTVVLLSLWGFAILAGLSPSVIRSVTMFSFVALGMHLKRTTNIFHTLLVSLFLILLFEPSFLFDVGFQLSYLALFFIVWLQPLLNDLWTPKFKIINYFWQILTVSFAAQIGTLPLSIYYFHQFPGLFFVTNLIIIPFLSLIMGVGVSVMLMAALNYVPSLPAEILASSVRILNQIINWIASFEQFIFKDIPFSVYMLAGLYLLILTAILWFEKPTFKKMVFALIALVLFQASYFGARWSNRNKQEWIVFNARKSTMIAERNGEAVTIYADSTAKNALLQSYLLANFCHIKSKLPLQHSAYFKSRKIMLLDNLGRYPKKVNPDVLILHHSPKVNLTRMLQSCRPKIIVADGSNYKSYVKRWSATCAQEKIPFHATDEKGFYKLE